MITNNSCMAQEDATTAYAICPHCGQQMPVRYYEAFSAESKPEPDYYEMGRQAALDGLPAQVNPYHPFQARDEHASWLRGWNAGSFSRRWKR